MEVQSKYDDEQLVVLKMAVLELDLVALVAILFSVVSSHHRFVDNHSNSKVPFFSFQVTTTNKVWLLVVLAKSENLESQVSLKYTTYRIYRFEFESACFGASRLTTSPVTRCVFGGGVVLVLWGGAGGAGGVA
ncbi:MAG: hypothetical protein GY768_22055 [Planctomycetaceae bacterium]|nr:hypothetical protein [Planctomycetaceae bacterium]